MKLTQKPIEQIFYDFNYISSNGTMGVSDIACECETGSLGIYEIFKNDYIQMQSIGNWLAWYTKKPTKLYEILFTSEYMDTFLNVNFTLQASNDYVNWTTLEITSTPSQQNEYIYIYSSNDNYYHYYKLSGFPDKFSTIRITNFYCVSSASTTASILQPTRKYYKYSISAWTQPVLTSDGLIGGYSMAVDSSRRPSTNGQTYKAFDSNTSTYWYPVGTGSQGIPIILTIYIPEIINITNFQFMNANYGNNAPNAFTISASNDNVNYTSLGSFTNTVQSANATWNVDLSSNTGYYQYYKIEFTQWSGAATGGRGVKEIDITATQKKIIESTSSDYDFYKDVNAHMAVI